MVSIATTSPNRRFMELGLPDYFVMFLHVFAYSMVISPWAMEKSTVYIRWCMDYHMAMDQYLWMPSLVRRPICHPNVDVNRRATGFWQIPIFGWLLYKTMIVDDFLPFFFYIYIHYICIYTIYIYHIYIPYIYIHYIYFVYIYILYIYYIYIYYIYILYIYYIYHIYTIYILYIYYIYTIYTIYILYIYTIYILYIYILYIYYIYTIYVYICYIYICIWTYIWTYMHFPLGRTFTQSSVGGLSLVALWFSIYFSLYSGLLQVD